MRGRKKTPAPPQERFRPPALETEERRKKTKRGSEGEERKGTRGRERFSPLALRHALFLTRRGKRNHQRHAFASPLPPLPRGAMLRLRRRRRGQGTPSWKRGAPRENPRRPRERETDLECGVAFRRDVDARALSLTKTLTSPPLSQPRPPRPSYSPPPPQKLSPAHDPLRPPDQALARGPDPPRHDLGALGQQDSAALQLVGARGPAELQAAPGRAGPLRGPVLRRPLRPGLHVAVQRLEPSDHRVHQHSVGLHLELCDGRVRQPHDRRSEDLWTPRVEGLPPVRAELPDAADRDGQGGVSEWWSVYFELISWMRARGGEKQREKKNSLFCFCFALSPPSPRSLPPSPKQLIDA